MDYINQYESPLGRIIMAADKEAITGLWFEGQKYFGSTLKGREEEKEIPVFARARLWLDTYFQGKDPGFIPPLNLQATSFRKAVWDFLLTIPYGKTITYGELAAEIALQRGLASMSAQAVGGAVSHNPVSLFIPCHRVVGAGGSLTGYAAGVGVKESLLALERSGSF